MRPGPAHASVSAGSLCLDYLAAFEHWTDPLDGRSGQPQELDAWLSDAGLPSPTSGVTGADVADAQALRSALDAIARAVVTGVTPSAEDIRCLNSFAEHPTPVFLLRASGRQRVAMEQTDGSSSLAVVARDAVHLFGELDPSRIRACAREGCDTLFYDRSPSGRRRWCAMKGCGEIVASASYRRRRAAQPPSTSPRSEVGTA